MSIELSWVENLEDDLANYLVERSIVGTITENSAPFNIQTTDTLQIRVDGEYLLDVDFSAVTNGAATAAQVQSAIQSAIEDAGGKAKVAGDQVIIQSRKQNDRGSLRIVDGTALTGLGLTAKKYTLESDWYLIGEPTSPSLSDSHGESGYRYRVAALNDSDEQSSWSDAFSPTEEVLELSVIYGTLLDHSAKALANTEVQFGTPVLKRPSDDTLLPGQRESADFGIASNKLESVFTNDKGYFQMTVPAAIPLRIKIDSINFDQVFQTPSANSMSEFNKLNDAFNYQSFQLASQFDEFE